MAGVREKLLTASDLAALCEVDLKTIHNWVDRGRIAHFRTPGRHLRFRAADVADFLRAWGYTVPRELARASSRTVMVVGSREAASHVTRAVGEGLPVRHAAHPYDALVFAGAEPADVFVVEPREVGKDIDVEAFFEAIHRASPQAGMVALGDETSALPPFVTRIARADAAALRAALLPGEPAAPAVPAAEEPQRAAGGSR
jgi:excisionase family DNA binding protein